MDRWQGNPGMRYGGNEAFYTPNTSNRRTVEVMNDYGNQSSKGSLLGKLGHLKENEAKLALSVINVLMGDSGDDRSRLAGSLRTASGGNMDGGQHGRGGGRQQLSTSEEDLRSMLNARRRTSLPEYPQSSHMMQQSQRSSQFPIQPWATGPLARPSAPYAASPFQHQQKQQTSVRPISARIGPARVTKPLSKTPKDTHSLGFDLRNRLKMKAINKPNLHYVTKAYIKVGQKTTMIRDSRKIEPIVNQAKKTGEVVTLKVFVGFKKGIENFTKGLWQWAGKKQWTKGTGAKMYTCILHGEENDTEEDVELSSYPCVVCEKDYKSLTTFKSHQNNSHHRELSILYTMKLESVRGLLCAEEELTTNQKLAAQKGGNKNKKKMKTESDPKKPQPATEGVVSNKWDQQNQDETFSHFKQNSLRQLKNSFPMCYTCYKRFSNCENLIIHECTSTHLKNKLESEASDLEEFQEHFPTFELQEWAPLQRNTAAITDIVKDILKTRKRDKHGHPIVIYDPGCSSVSEFQDITRDCKYKCTVCPKSIFPEASRALQHFKSETHHHFYLEHLKGNKLEVPGRGKKRSFNKKNVKAEAEAEAEVKAEPGSPKQKPPTHQVTQEQPAKKKVVKAEDDTEIELDEMEVVGDKFRLDDAEEEEEEDAEEEEEEDMEVNQDQEGDSEEEEVEAEEVEAEEVEAEEVEAEEVEAEEAEEVEAEEVEAEEVEEQETGEHEEEEQEEEEQEEQEEEQEEQEEEQEEQEENEEEQKEHEEEPTVKPEGEEADEDDEPPPPPPPSMSKRGRRGRAK